MGIGIGKINGRLHLLTEQDGRRTVIRTWNKPTIYLRITADSRNNVHHFSVSSDGKHFEPVGETFAMQMGAWKGTRVGLFCYNTIGTGGCARFDYFRYAILK